MPTLSLLVLLQAISGITFVIYGGLLLSSTHMEVEFKRYNLSQFRILVGVLEFGGGLGVLIGYFYLPLLLFSSLGLSLLMLLGMMTRIRIRDPFVSLLPALILFVVNAAILALAGGSGH